MRCDVPLSMHPYTASTGDGSGCSYVGPIHAPLVAATRELGRGPTTVDRRNGGEGDRLDVKKVKRLGIARKAQTARRSEGSVG